MPRVVHGPLWLMCPQVAQLIYLGASSVTCLLLAPPSSFSCSPRVQSHVWDRPPCPSSRPGTGRSLAGGCLGAGCSGRGRAICSPGTSSGCTEGELARLQTFLLPASLSLFFKLVKSMVSAVCTQSPLTGPGEGRAKMVNWTEVPALREPLLIPTKGPFACGFYGCEYFLTSVRVS